MPRIFMTYEEIADTFGGTAASAREGAIECRLSRYKGSDGLTQVGLTPAMTAEFLRQVAERALARAETDGQVASLRELSAAMCQALARTSNIRRVA